MVLLGCHWDAERPRAEPPGQPRLVSRQTQPQAGRVGSIELLGVPNYPRGQTGWRSTAHLYAGWIGSVRSLANPINVQPAEIASTETAVIACWVPVSAGAPSPGRT